MTEEDWNMLDYFWNDKGNLTRWVGWDQFRVANPNHPIVLEYARYEASKEAVTLLIRGSRP